MKPIGQPDSFLDPKTGQLSGSGYRDILAMKKASSSNTATLDVITARPAPDIGVAIAFVENKTYVMDPKASVAYKIDESVSISGAGTCTATVYIDGVAITATANSVSTTLQTRVPTANNAVPVGSRVTTIVTGNSGCEDAIIKCKCSYT